VAVLAVVGVTTACGGSAGIAEPDALVADASVVTSAEATAPDCDALSADTTAPPDLALSTVIDAETLRTAEDLLVAELVVGEGCVVHADDIVVFSFLSQNPPDDQEFHNTWKGDAQFMGPQRVIAGVPRVFAGMDDALIGMHVGGERIVGIPPAIGWGESGLLVRIHLHEVVPAPFAHTAQFAGDAPTETQITTVIDGSGDAAEFGDTLVANLVERVFSDGRISGPSSWEMGRPREFELLESEADPLFSGAVGIRPGELREIIVPTSVLFPDGDDAAAFGLADDDAFVYFLEAVEVIKG